MKIDLHKDVERSIVAAADCGQFASGDDAMTEAARPLLRQIPQTGPGSAEATPDPFLGSMREYADELDKIMADAMKRRREEPWRVIPGE